MKIWEIEEGKEFRENKFELYRYRIINGELQFENGGEWRYSALSYNNAIQMNFEYIPEKKYYLRLKPEMKGEQDYNYLNFVVDENIFYISNNYDSDAFKTQFTEKEIKELIPPLWLDVCKEPIEVGNE